jgi:hypothetical protein
MPTDRKSEPFQFARVRRDGQPGIRLFAAKLAGATPGVDRQPGVILKSAARLVAPNRLSRW